MYLINVTWEVYILFVTYWSSFFQYSYKCNQSNYLIRPTLIALEAEVGMCFSSSDLIGDNAILYSKF